MGSISKSVKLSKQCELGSDIISFLPCDVISHILSFLPTKEAISTSVLSTRWKHAWHLVTKLDLNDDSFSPKYFSCVIFRLLLQRRGSRLSDFYLRCKKCHFALDINAWINAALFSNVQQLNISASLVYGYLCTELFFSTTLVVLKLRANFVMYVPSSVCLPCLKVVDLSFVRFLDDDSLTRFICGCPVLEELTLSRCIGVDVHVINIVSPLLTRLVLEDMPVCGTDEFESAIKCKIMINAPSLLYLEMKNFFDGGYVIVDLHNLIEARVAISSDFDDLLPSDYEAVGDYVVITNLFKGISNVQSLHVSWFDNVYIWPVYFELPEFPKLTYLELFVDMENNFLPEMLKISPCLETLVYKQRFHPYSSAVLEKEARAFEISSFSKSLKVIEIKGVNGLKCADNMIMFFSENVKALEKLIVQSDDLLEDDLAMVTYFLKKKDHKIKKITMELNVPPYLRKWIFDCTR